MKFSRRNILEGAAAGAITLATGNHAVAVPPKPKSASASSALPANKRSSININGLDVFEYAFIDHTRQGDNFPGPIGAYYANSPVPWTQLIDSDGWPNNSAANGLPFGGGVRIPGAGQFAGPYVITWEGDGTVQVVGSGTWTEVNGAGTSYRKLGNGSWSSISGQRARIIANLSGANGPQLLLLCVWATGGSGGFLKNLKFYRLEDEADLLTGKIFRRGFKQLYVDYNPSLIRFMDWNMVNNSQLSRFEQRTTPGKASYVSNWVAGPRYGTTSGSNRMVLPGVAGTPGSMQHGELVTCRIGAGMARAGTTVVTSISQSNPGIVTAVGHGFSTGDVIVHQMMSPIPGQAPAGMVELNNTPCAIAVIDENTYSIGTDTSLFSSFTIGTAYQYVTLNVGGRGEYPVVYVDGVSPASRYGSNYLATGDYKTFTFDKEIIASSTVKGAWLMSNGGSQAVLQSGVPLEVCTALVNELMQMTTSGSIDMWVCIPHRGMISSDQDYAPSSNWPVNMVNTILNGANGYAGLDSRCKLYVEHSNETWNTGFPHANFLKKIGYQRWPASGPYDVSSYSTLRAVLSIEEIKAAFPGSPRIHYVLSGQGAVGPTHVVNAYRLNGSVYFNSDTLNTWRTDPMSHFDYFAWAGYFYNPDDGSSGSNSLGICTNAWLAASSAGAKEAACATYVVGIVGTGTGETTSRYAGTLLPAYATAVAAKGKKTIMYEGGWDHGVEGFTQGQNAFLAACKRSAAWAQALRNFHDAFNAISVAECPAEYIMVNNRWGHSSPDTYSGGVEGGNLDLAWQYLAARNKGTTV